MDQHPVGNSLKQTVDISRMGFSGSTGLMVNRLFERCNLKTVLFLISRAKSFSSTVGVSPQALSGAGTALVLIAACQSRLEMIASGENRLKLIVWLSIMHKVL